MAKMFSWRKPTGSPATNGFDVSRRDTYSTVPGVLNCPRPRVVGPKTKCKLTLADCIFNSLPTINQPFNRGSFYVDFYQVPMTQIMHRFDDFYTQLAEKFSSSGLATNSDDVALPYLLHVDLWVLSSLCMLDLKYFFELVSSFDRDDGHYKWFQYLPNDYDAQNFETYSALGVDVHGYPVVFGLLRLLDLMEYSNWYLMLKEFILNDCSHDNSYTKDLATWCQYVFDNLISGEDTTEAYLDAVTAMITQIEGQSTTTMAHAIGCCFNIISVFNASEQFTPHLYGNMLNFYAYQKVFNDIYRNSFYDTVSPFAYSTDWFVDQMPFTEQFEFFCLLRSRGSALRGNNPLAYQVFQIRYRQFKNDMFTSLLPNSQFGDVSMVNVGDSVFNLNTVTRAAEGADNNFLGISSRGDIMARTGSSAAGQRKVDFTASNLTFSVLMQRRAEALQKYKERFLRAGNRLKDQYISEFGKVPYYLEDKYVRYLGSMSSALKVQGVPATSDSGEYNVGERAAYAYAGIDGQIEFTCDDWSIIVPIMYYLPETDYEAFGLGAQNKFSEFTDYYVPEFENLGLEPVYRTTLSLLATTLAGGSYEVGGERVIGYGPSYMYFKTDIDKVHGEFGSTGYLNGVFSSWVTTRGNVSMSELSDYYVRPDFCNSIFKTQYNGSQSTDQFLCCLGFDWKAIEPLSVVGLPIWE